MSNPMGDRNLLAGILAHQKKFISREVLVAAMNAWTQAKEKGLAQILREQKALTENQHALLEEAVYDQLAKHGNDAKKSLAALKSVDAIKQELAKIADADLKASVAHVATAKPKVKPTAAAPILAAEVAQVVEAPKKKPAKVAPQKSAAPAEQPARGISILALLLGGGIVGALLLLLALVGTVLAVVLMREKPITPPQPDEAPIARGKDENKPGEKPPSKDPGNGGKQADPPIEPEPIVDRKPTEVVGDAEWRVEKDELVVNNSTPKRVFLYFGSKAWGDYDFSFETSSSAGNSGPLALFRAANQENHYGFSLGAFMGVKHTLSRVEKEVMNYDVPEVVEPFKLNHWYAVRIEARGNQIRCFLDGKQIFDYKNNAHARGQVALGATREAQARWRNILVTTPNGRVLWEGPPDLAGTPGPLVEIAPQFVVEIPRPAGRACLSADGARVVYTLPIVGSFGYREGPAFDGPETAGIPGTITHLHPLASSPDGRKMAFTAGSRDGPRVYLWNWATMSAETSFMLSNLAISSAFSPDGKYLATYLIQTLKGKPVEYWLHLHDATVGQSLNQWKLDSEPTLFGFTPDSGTIYFACKEDQTARTFTIATNRASTLAFPQIGKKHYFARDFSKFAYVDNPHRLQLGFVDGLRSLGKVDTKKDVSHLYAAAFSADNRYVLVGTQETEPGAAVVPVWRGGKGRGTLFDVASGKPFSTTDELDGVPDRVELAKNGIGLLQSQKLRPRLYRFPTGPGELLVKQKDPPVVPPANDFVPLFNGKNLTGWTPHEQLPGKWQIENGVLIGEGGKDNHGMLFTERPRAKDFHLRFEAKVSDFGSGNVRFRCPAGTIVGYDLVINSNVPSLGKTGTLRATMPGKSFEVVVVRKTQVQPEQWCVIDVIAQGAHLIVKVDGQVAVDIKDQNIVAAAGHIALCSANGTIAFRKVEIKEGNFVAAPPPPPAPADGFVQLFNGKDMTGWKVNKTFPGAWLVDNGVLMGAGGNGGRGILETEKIQPRDFHLRIETRINAKGAGFVNFRAVPDHKFAAGYTSSINALTRGLELAGLVGNQLLNGGYRGVPQLRDVPLFRPQPGEWFTLEIICQGNHLITKVNGVERVNVIDASYSEAGNILLIAVTQPAIEFRKIEIKELKGDAAPPLAVARDFVPLFNGKDLTGWKKHPRQGGNWAVENGLLVGSGDGIGNLAGLLFSDRVQPKNFHLRVEARVGAKGHGGVMIRCPETSMFGYEAGLGSVPGAVSVGTLRYQTPGESGFLPGRAVRVMPPDQWITLEIIANEKRLIVKVNGEVTTDVEDAKALNAGHIRLSHSSSASKIEFRKIEIKELDAGAPPGPVVVVPKDVPPPKDAPPFAAVKDFVPLFNGKDLTGWKLPVGGFADAWRVEKGVLTGAAPPQRLIRLHTEAKFKDFHLRAEVRSADKAGGVLGFRSSDGVIRGYNTGMMSMGPGGVRTGVLNCNTPTKNFGVSRPGADVKLPPGQWFNLEVIAQGNRFQIFVDGKKITDLPDDTVADAGFIYLGLMGTGTLEFRKIEIKVLNAVAVAPPPVMKDAPPVVKEGVVPLFNGKDLTGWQPHAKRPGNWRVENGILIGSAPIGGSLYSTRGDYQDFHLRAELRINDKGFGRIFGRATYDPTKIPFKVLGYEVLINQRPLGDKTGSLTARSAAQTSSTQAKEAPAPAGEWIALEVIAKGDLVTVKVNGNVVAEFQDDKRQFARSGHIALHQDANATIEFRKVEIEDLNARAGAEPAPAAPPPALPPVELPKGGKFVPLFNNKDLIGWKTFGNEKDHWRIKDGILLGAGDGASRIHSPRDDYKDFHLRIEARVSDQGAAGAIVRAPFSSFKGYEAKINSNHPSANKTGSLEAWVPGKTVNLASVRESPVPAEEWFTMEVIALGNRVIVIVNGKVTADTIEVDGAYASGHIALRYVANSQIEVRKIEIREFPAP